MNREELKILMDGWCALGIIARILSTPAWIASLTGSNMIISLWSHIGSIFSFKGFEFTLVLCFDLGQPLNVQRPHLDLMRLRTQAVKLERIVLINIVLLDEHSHLI